MTIVFDTWREDIRPKDGTVIPNVLFVRGTKGDISFQTPCFIEDEQDISDAKQMIAKVIERTESEL